MIQQAQARLAQLGFDPGPLDGQLGPRTAAALRQLQAIYGLPESGRIDRATLSALTLDQGSPDTALIRHVQARLRHTGFDPGPVDGRLGLRTAVALRQFQASHGLGVTGKVDDETLAALANSMRQENRDISEFHEPNVPRKQALEETLLWALNGCRRDEEARKIVASSDARTENSTFHRDLVVTP